MMSSIGDEFSSWCALDNMEDICDAGHALACQVDSQDYRNCPSNTLGVFQGEDTMTWSTPEDQCVTNWMDCMRCGFEAPLIPLPNAAVRIAVFDLYQDGNLAETFSGKSLARQREIFYEVVKHLSGEITREQVATVISNDFGVYFEPKFVGGPTTMNFNDAVDYCESLQPEHKLATIETDAEFSEAQAECTEADKDCWIGLKRKKNAPWKWTDQDGSSSALVMENKCPLPTKPSFWFKAEPQRSQSKSACAHLNKKKKFFLRDSGCGGNKRPLCRLL